MDFFKTNTLGHKRLFEASYPVSVVFYTEGEISQQAESCISYAPLWMPQKPYNHRDATKLSVE